MTNEDIDPCAIPLTVEQAEAIGFTSGLVAGGDTFGDEDDENPSHPTWDARAPQIILDAVGALCRALLITAAPELLAALKATRGHVLWVCEHNERVNGGRRSEEDRRDLEIIDAAISKAEVQP